MVRVPRQAFPRLPRLPGKGTALVLDFPMAETLPGVVSPRLSYLGDEYRDHVVLAVSAMPRVAADAKALLGAAKALLGQVPLGFDMPLRPQDVRAIEQAVALAMLALRAEAKGPAPFGPLAT